MKKAILFLSLLFTHFGWGGENLLIMGTNPSYPPYESINAKGQCEGFDIDMGEAIASKLNKKLLIKQFNFDALILALKQGKVDVVLSGMSVTSARLKEIAMIPYQGEPITCLSLTFWKKIPENYRDLKDLKSIAVQTGTFQEAYLQELQDVKTKPLEGSAEIIMDLQHGKSPAAIFEPHIAQAMKKKFPELEVVAIPFDEQHKVFGNGVGIKKKNITLMREVEEAVADLKREGVVQKLETKWFGS